MPSAPLDIAGLDLMSPARLNNLETAEGRGRVAAMVADARREFLDDLDRGLGGKTTHARLAARTDDLVRQIVEAATPRGRHAPPVAVAAVGGYGRSALCLYSDIDLLIVFDHALGRSEERFLKAILHPLWDARLSVGHQVRTVPDFAVPELDNPEFLLALLDARFVAGNVAVFERAASRFRPAGEGIREDVLECLLQLTDERHAQFNRTIYQLEPDVKDAPGGLRDVVAARLLASVGRSTLSRADGNRLEQAEDFLMRVRAAIHVETGRNVNVLTHELQEKIADRLGCPGALPQMRVEALMGEYFRQARGVERARERARRLPGPSGRDTTRVALAPNIELMADGIAFTDPQRAGAEPASWLAVLEHALDRGAPIADEALAVFETWGSHYAPADYLPSLEARDRLLRCLHVRPGLYARLSELHDCGLLARVFPEFEAITGRVIRDFYHKYTVDEHTLLTIRALERLGAPDQPSRERFSSLLHELHGSHVLVLALLFHDVGKWKDGNHAEESARMAEAMLDRLGLAPEERQDVQFLIGQHLQMSRVAFLRDTEDPTVVQRFAALVGTEDRLKLLCLLTLADIDAVSPGTLTPWKEELLWRLYVDTYNQLTLGYGDEVIEHGQAAVQALETRRPGDIGAQELARFLEGFPRRYLTLFDEEHIYRHARLARDIHSDEVHLFLEQKGDVWELAVATLDKPFLFSNISGALSYFGMDILRGNAMTQPTGLVLDIFQFTDAEGFFRLNPSGPARFESLLQEIVAGRTDVHALVLRKERGLLHRRGPSHVAPVVYFDNEHSQRYTVLEIVAENAVGLLYRISRVISTHGCDVDLVLISTEGNKAIDVFHLTDSAAKLSLSAQVALKVDLERMLEEGYEAD